MQAVSSERSRFHILDNLQVVHLSVTDGSGSGGGGGGGVAGGGAAAPAPPLLLL